MKCYVILALLIGSLAAFGADTSRENGSGQPAFRIRTDFAAPLNSDHGWAGALNENVAVNADQPFRLRMEVESRSESSDNQSWRLQYRRNHGEWTDVEAHDFPYPNAELELDFASTEVGATPQGWSVARGEAAEFAVAMDGAEKVLRAKATREPFMALYSPPWEAEQFSLAAEIRLSAENRSGVGVVFGIVDQENFGRVFLDAAAGAIRVSRFVDGNETLMAERKVGIPSGEWIAIEIEFEDGELAVNFQDDALEFTTSYRDAVSPSALGIYIADYSAADFRKIQLEGEPRTPRVSIVACPAYENGAPTTDLLKGSSAEWRTGAGISLAHRTAAWGAKGTHGEFVWPLVVRRFADGAVTNEEGDSFGFRMIDAGGALVNAGPNPVLRLAIPPGHVGGTFVETPGRIGPWQASNGDLYFIMEPAETSNLFMMVKSTDNGRSWSEVDGANRPRTNDLESVDSRQVADTIHIIHQVTHSTRYHTFRTSDHPTAPDTWDVRDELGASADSVAQGASLVVRSDGSLVAFHVGATLHYSVRSPSGVWSPETIIDNGVEPMLAGPQAVLGANDTVHVAYYGMDGTIWYRRLLPDGTLTARQPLASGLGATRAEFGSVLPLVFNPSTNTVVILYRMSDGKLWARRVVNDGTPTPPEKVTDRDVVQQAVDSQQPGADVVLDGETIHVLFIEESSRSIFSTHDRGGWQSSIPRVENIQGSWVRGNIYIRPDGTKVYGFVYDAGSRGGAGLNRFGEIVLSKR